MLDRRLAEMERLVENKHRLGHIEDVKFDDKNRRWLVKFRDGPAPKQDSGSGSGGDSGSSGGDSGGSQPDGGSSQGNQASQNRTVMTDWIPWVGMSHGTIKASVPPKKGQKVECKAPNGRLEHATVSPFSYGEGSECPHDKPDEVYFRIEKDTTKKDSNGSSSSSSASSGSTSSDSASSSSSSSGSDSQQPNNEQMNFHGTKDGMQMWIGNSKIAMDANGITFTTGKHTITMHKDDGIKHSFNDGQHTTVMNKDGLKDSIANSATIVELTKDHANSQSKQIQAKSDDGSASVTIDDSGVNTLGKSINDGD